MFFNIAGPCIPGEHYLVPALARVPELSGLIAKKQAQLAKTTDQVKRAKLAAEIKQLQTQQTMLAQSTAAGLADTQGSYQGGGGSGGVSTTPPWLWPVVITGGLLLVGGGALILSRK